MIVYIIVFVVIVPNYFVKTNNNPYSLLPDEKQLLELVYQSRKAHWASTNASKQCICRCDDNNLYSININEDLLIKSRIKSKRPIVINETDDRQMRNTKMIICYYSNWAQYRPDSWMYVPENVDYSLCTHYVYAFAVLDNITYQIKSYEWNDEDLDNGRVSGMYRRFVRQVKRGSGIPLLAVGGWNLGMVAASRMLSSHDTRSYFIQSSIILLRKYGFEGLDVDFEYPGNEDRNGAVNDKANFVNLLKEFREAVITESKSSGLKELILSAAVAPLSNRADKAYKPTELAKYLDFISVMAYDIHGSWEDTIGFNAPLLPSINKTGLNHHWCLRLSIDYWINEQKFPAHKINVGLANYGRSFTLKTNGESDSIGPGKAGSTTREPGILSFFEIMNLVKDSLKNQQSKVFERTFDTEHLVPYVTNGVEWIGYDDTTSILLKTEFAKCRKLGGVMFWTIDLDDFRGDTYDKLGRKHVAYPLINTARNSIKMPVIPQLCDYFNYRQ